MFFSIFKVYESTHVTILYFLRFVETRELPDIGPICPSRVLV